MGRSLRIAVGNLRLAVRPHIRGPAVRLTSYCVPDPYIHAAPSRLSPAHPGLAEVLRRDSKSRKTRGFASGVLREEECDGNVGMRDATLCGCCWKKLVPGDDAEAAATPPIRGLGDLSPRAGRR